MELREKKVDEGWQVELMERELSISRTWVVDRSMRIGRAVVEVGGIGGVGTLPEYRRKGYSRQVMEAAVELMKREGYDISFLHGIQDFYHKYGFITCMAEHEFWLDTRDAERAAGGARTRPMRPGDLAAVVRIYNRDNANRTGSTLRDLRSWRGFTVGTWWTIRASVRVVVDGRDRVIGYVAYDQVSDCCRASEVGGEGEKIYAAILGFLAKRAVALRREKVWANVPVDHPFAIYCRQFGLHLNSFYPRNEKPMGRIIDLSSTMEKLLPELAHRWGERDRGEVLALKTDVGGGSLRWKGGGLTYDEGATAQAVRLSQQSLMQLIMGYIRPSDLNGSGRAKIPRRQRDLLERVFPLQEAQLWWADRF